jgi:hypothetical protein
LSARPRNLIQKANRRRNVDPTAGFVALIIALLAVPRDKSTAVTAHKCGDMNPG